MPKQADPTKTIKDFIDFCRDRKPKDAPNSERALRYVVPMLATSDANMLAVPATAEELEQLSPQILASRLWECLDEDNNWAPGLIKDCPELARIPALKRDYRRAFVRCLKHASASHLISTSVIGVAPEMQATRTELVSIVPHTLESAQALLDSGSMDFYGYPLANTSAKVLRTSFQQIISSYTCMLRHFTGLGIERLQDVRPDHIYGHPSSWYKACKAEQVKVIYYNSRWAWRILGQIHPEWNFADWPEPNKGRSYILQESIPLVVSMLKDIFHESHLADATIEDITIDVRRYLGYLSTQGCDLRSLCRTLRSPLDLATLLFSGFPPTPNGIEPDAEEERKLIFNNPPYVASLLTELHAAVRLSDYQGSLRANPLMAGYCDWHMRRRTAPSAFIFLTRAKIIAQRYVRVHSSQFEWYKPLKIRLKRCKDSTPPTPYSERKETVSLDSDFWLKLVEERRRLSDNRASLKSAIEAETEPKKKSGLKRKWATVVRNELIFCFLLAFSLRSGNIRLMKIGVDVILDQYLVRIPKHRVKNRAPILRPMYDEGVFGDMKELFDIYYYEARPILLGDRAETPYLFVTNYVSEDMEVRDREGYLMMSSGYVSLIVRRLSIKVFQDLLPGDLDDIGSHILRHAKTNFLFPKGGDTLASQGIGTHVNNVRLAYLGTMKGTDPDVRRIIQSIPTDKPSNRKLSRTEVRQAVAKRIEKESGVKLDPAAITRILEGFNL